MTPEPIKKLRAAADKIRQDNENHK